MNYPITRTKVILPARHKHILSRRRLLDLLGEVLDHRLALISAPAGYGKTSLLVDLAARVDYPVCWLALDPLDADPVRFLHYLIAAVRQQFPDFGEPSSALVSAQAGRALDWERILQTLVNDLYDHIEEHFALVLDDYHFVDSSQEINQFINRFVQEIDDNCHLVIATRQLVSLPDLPLMIARSQVFGLSFEELAFAGGEIRELYSLRYSQQISDQKAEEIQKRTEGWITGLLLSAESSLESSTDLGRAARSAGVGLYDYLARQVLELQPPALQEFLLRTSLLEEFDTDLCEQALGDPPGGGSWEELLQQVLQRNLFIQPVEDRGTWLRYHQLLRDFLQGRFHEQSPERSREINLKLVEIYRERGWFEKAYAVISRLGDDTLKAEFIEAACSEMIHTGQISLLQAWLQELPWAAMRTMPALVACQAGIASLTGDPGFGLDLIDQVIDDPGLEDEPLLKAQLLIRRAACQRLLGSCQEGFEDAVQALALADGLAGEGLQRAEAEREIGLNLLRLGRNQQAQEHLERALSSYLELDDPRNAAYLQVDLGYLEMNRGRYKNAKTLFNRAYQVWEEQGNIDRLVGLCNNLGVLDHLSGEYPAAFSWFTKALDFARQTSNQWEKAYTLASLADLSLDLGALPAAEDYLERAWRIAEDFGDSYLQIYLLLSRAVLARKKGDPKAVGRSLKRAEGMLGELPPGFEAGRFQLERGLWEMMKDAPEQAATAFRSAREIFSGLDLPVETGLAHGYLAWADCRLGSAEKAGGRLGSVRELTAKLGTIQPLIPRLAEPVGMAACFQDSLPGDAFVAEISREAAAFRTRLPGLQAELGLANRPSQPSRHPRLEIRALGRISLRIEGQPITAPEWVKQRTVRELFFYLLNYEEGAAREEICLEFWPDSPSETLNKQFKNALYRLRRALGKDTILLDPNTRLYHFNRGLDYRYDVQEYLERMEGAERQPDPEKRIQLLEEAAALYRHPFAPALDGIWAEPVRYRLYLEYERAVFAIAEFKSSRGEYDPALDLLEKLLVIQPSQEEAWRQVMRIHALKGDRSGIERAYQRCLTALSQDLGSEPSPETLNLYRDLMS